MARTVVCLEGDDKRWLEERAAKEGVPMTELIRRGVRLLREQRGRERPGRDELLERTAGTWRRGDGLKYQKKVRNEW